jgi:hypothetical protein
MTRRRQTPEEKVAKQIENITSDLRLDLDLVGRYLANSSPTVSYNRLLIIAESAEFEKESINVRTYHDPLF